jgi:hypothetical protein
MYEVNSAELYMIVSYEKAPTLPLEEPLGRKPLAAAAPRASSLVSPVAAGGHYYRAKPARTTVAAGLCLLAQLLLPAGSSSVAVVRHPDGTLMVAKIGSWDGGPRSWRWSSSHGGWRHR